MEEVCRCGKLWGFKTHTSVCSLCSLPSGFRVQLSVSSQVCSLLPHFRVMADSPLHKPNHPFLLCTAWIVLFLTARTNRELGVSGGGLLQRTWPHRVLNRCEGLWDLELENWWDTVRGKVWNRRTFLVGAWKTVALRAMQTMEAHHKRFQRIATVVAWPHTTAPVI